VKTIQKFYQLRIMDFLVRKVTLEYEIHFHREKFLDQMEAERTDQATSSVNEEASEEPAAHYASVSQQVNALLCLLNTTIYLD